jgi:Immunoglobulin domain
MEGRFRSKKFLNLSHFPDRPIFAKHHDYVNTAENLDALLTCSFTADPSPSSVRWFRDEGASKVRLHQNEKYEVVNDYHDKHNRSALVIKDVKQGDLLDYICEVEVSFWLRVKFLRILLID